MIKIIKKYERDLLLRPSVDHLFYDNSDLDFHFQSIMIDVIEDLMDIKVKENAYKYFLNSDNIWYLKTDEKYTYLKIVLKEIETDTITEDFLIDVIHRNENHIIEVIENLGS